MNSFPKSYTLSLYTSMNEQDIVDLNCDFNSSSRVLKYFTQRGISPIPSLFSMNSILPFELSPNIVNVLPLPVTPYAITQFF